MNKSKMSRLAGLVTAIAIGVLALPALASAADRNRDRIPDKWEKQYKLSLKVKQTKRDQDRDGLRNLAEYRSGNNPRKADSDKDGTEDGDENAGTITSYEDGVLTIDLYNGGSITGKVTDDTRVICAKAEDDPAEEESESSARHPGGNQGQGSGENEGQENENEGEGEHSGPGPNQGPGENSGPGKGGGECSTCSADDLAVGDVVEEAEVSLRNGDATFTKIKLADSSDDDS